MKILSHASAKKKTEIIKEFQISHFYWSLLNDFVAAKGSILSYLRVYPSQCHDEMVVFLFDLCLGLTYNITLSRCLPTTVPWQKWALPESRRWPCVVSDLSRDRLQWPGGDNPSTLTSAPSAAQTRETRPLKWLRTVARFPAPPAQFLKEGKQTALAPFRHRNSFFANSKER